MNKKQKIKLLLVSFCLLYFLATNAHVNNDHNIWHGKFFGGGIINTGNSATKSLHSKINMKYAKQVVDNVLNLEHQLNKNGKQTTSSKFVASNTMRYNIDGRHFIFADLNVKYDEFGTYDYSFKEVIGYGYKIYESNSMKISLDGGPGFTQSKIAGTKDYQVQIVGKFGLLLNKKISKEVQYFKCLAAYIGYDNTYIQLKQALETRMSKRLSMELSFVLECNSLIPSSSKNKFKIDTVMKISIIYDLV